MAREPLFTIGEEVIMVSKTYPEYDGTYIVTGIITGEDFLKTHPYFTSYESLYYYELEGLFIQLRNGHNTLTEHFTSYVRESFLRKKHKPSKFGSFTNLMNSLKLPQEVK